MEKTKTGRCLFVEPDCKTRPRFGLVGTTIGLYCSKHRPPNYVDVKSKRCQETECNTIPSYGPVGTKTALSCAKHRRPDYVDVTRKRCQGPECHTTPYYGPVGGKALYCARHKPNDHVDVKQKRCLAPECNTIPYYGLLGTKTGLYCATHKEEHHVDVKNKRCRAPECTTFPYYGPFGTKKGIYCLLHKEDGHVNVLDDQCIHRGCSTLPSYGLVGTKKAFYCSSHRLSEHINVRAKLCEHSGCNYLASYGPVGTTTVLYCSSHRLSEHINVRIKKCMDCSSRVYYGIPGRPPTRCAKHKEDGMLPNPRKRCEEPKCTEIAVFGYRSQMHCEDHKLAGEINLVHRTCVRCNLPDIVDERMICATCDPEVEKRVRLAKQKEIKDYFDANGLRYISYDRIIDNGWLGKERPDFLFDAETHYVIVEVDEEQHRNSPCYCVGEQTRMVNISQILNGKTELPKPVVFIRYNPDLYTPAKGRQVSNNSRKNKLKEWVNHFLKNKPTVFCSAIQLFFDGYEDGKIHSFTLFE